MDLPEAEFVRFELTEQIKKKVEGEKTERLAAKLAREAGSARR